MKQTYILLLIHLLIIGNIFGQKMVIFNKKNLTTVEFKTSDIDSIRFLNGEQESAEIFKNDHSTESIIISDIDSITFETRGMPTALTTENIGSLTDISVVLSGKVTSGGGFGVTERGIVLSEQPEPTLSDLKFAATGTMIINREYKITATELKSGTLYYYRAYAFNNNGIGYGETRSFTTIAVEKPSIITQSYVHRSKRGAILIGTVKNYAQAGTLKEYGIIWGKNKGLTIDSTHIKAGSIHAESGEFGCFIDQLEAETQYYGRPYVMTSSGIFYGIEKSFKTTAGGNVRYTLNKAEKPNSDELDAYRLIKIAMDSCCYYFNNYSNCDKQIWANYNTGVPTAQASSSGWMEFGANRRYMCVETAQHETAHTLGSGTSWVWSNTLIQNGLYTGKYAAQVMRVFKGQNQTLKGDGWHFWPGGINQKEEVSSYLDLIMQAMMLGAMKADGL